MLKAEVEKTQQLEGIIRGMTARISQLLDELLQDSSFTDNSASLRLKLDQLELHNSLSVSFDRDQDCLLSSLSISQEWDKLVDVLEGAFRSCQQRTQACQREVVALSSQLAQANSTIGGLQAQDSEELQRLKVELREERKQREKLRGLLDKTEIEKNELINRINAIGQRDPEVKEKSKEELLQYSKELNYRIRDLEKDKEDILKATNRDQQTQLKKYQDILRQFRSIKEGRRTGNICA
jgi:hypothetical protein